MPLQWYKFEQRYNQQQQHQQQCQSQRAGGEEEEWRQLPKNSGLVFAAYGITYGSRWLPLYK